MTYLKIKDWESEKKKFPSCWLSVLACSNVVSLPSPSHRTDTRMKDLSDGYGLMLSRQGKMVLIVALFVKRLTAETSASSGFCENSFEQW